MKVAIVFAVALFAVASASPANKNLITEIIKGIIDSQRPKLVDLFIERIDLGENGAVLNIQTKNIDTFVLEKLESNDPITAKIRNATISLATASATGILNVTDINIEEIGLVLNGEGEFSGSANDIWGTVRLDIHLNGLTPVLDDFTNLEVRVGSINGETTGVDNAEAVTQIINNDLAPFLTNNIPRIADENKAVIIEKINEVLSEITL